MSVTAFNKITVEPLPASWVRNGPQSVLHPSGRLDGGGQAEVTSICQVAIPPTCQRSVELHVYFLPCNGYDECQVAQPYFEETAEVSPLATLLRLPFLLCSSKCLKLSTILSLTPDGPELHSSC